VRLDDFDYLLPQERIAQHPCEPRDASRLLVLDPDGDGLRHSRFADLPGRLESGDLLVFNDTRVLPARLVGHKETGGRVELLLLEPRLREPRGETWRCLMQVSRKPQVPSWLVFGEGRVRAQVIERGEDGWLVRFPDRPGGVEEMLWEIGRMPLPPYIHRNSGDSDREDRDRYQTVFARHPGAVAAPTAGLHFTGSLLARLEEAGVTRANLTLHVGAGTFTPVRSERVEDHRMHTERFELPPQTADAIRDARSRGGRVVAVGTTAVRTLEGCAKGDGLVAAGRGECDLFIYPGYRFEVVDAIITNFHLPRSTLLMLVCAFAGRRRILEAYAAALREGYRFYSYGDAMLMNRRG